MSDTQVSDRTSKLEQHAELLGGFVHDLHNYAGVLSGSLEMMDRLLEKDTLPRDSLKRYLEKCTRHTSRIVNLAGKYRMIVFGNESEEATEVDLGEFFEGVTEIFESRMKMASVQMDIELKPMHRAVVKETTLLQVFVNLIANSIQEIVQNDLENRWIKISTSKKGTKSTFIVSDSGLGISPEIIERIFDKGFTTKELSENSGAGRGLSFVKNYVENELGGSVDVLRGTEHTTFRVIIDDLA